VALSLNTSRHEEDQELMVRPQCCLFILDLAVPRLLELRGKRRSDPDDDIHCERRRQKYGSQPRDMTARVKLGSSSASSPTMNAVDMRS